MNECKTQNSYTSCLCDSDLCNGDSSLFPTPFFTIAALIIFKEFTDLKWNEKWDEAGNKNSMITMKTSLKSDIWGRRLILL